MISTAGTYSRNSLGIHIWWSHMKFLNTLELRSSSERVTMFRLLVVWQAIIRLLERGMGGGRGCQEGRDGRCQTWGEAQSNPTTAGSTATADTLAIILVWQGGEQGLIRVAVLVWERSRAVWRLGIRGWVEVSRVTNRRLAVVWVWRLCWVMLNNVAFLVWDVRSRWRSQIHRVWRRTWQLNGTLGQLKWLWGIHEGHWRLHILVVIK